MYCTIKSSTGFPGQATNRVNPKTEIQMGQRYPNTTFCKKTVDTVLTVSIAAMWSA